MAAPKQATAWSQSRGPHFSHLPSTPADWELKLWNKPALPTLLYILPWFCTWRSPPSSLLSFPSFSTSIIVYTAGTNPSHHCNGKGHHPQSRQLNALQSGGSVFVSQMDIRVQMASKSPTLSLLEGLWWNYPCLPWNCCRLLLNTRALSELSEIRLIWV